MYYGIKYLDWISIPRNSGNLLNHVSACLEQIRRFDDEFEGRSPVLVVRCRKSPDENKAVLPPRIIALDLPHVCSDLGDHSVNRPRLGDYLRVHVLIFPVDSG